MRLWGKSGRGCRATPRVAGNSCGSSNNPGLELELELKL